MRAFVVVFVAAALLNGHFANSSKRGRKGYVKQKVRLQIGEIQNLFGARNTNAEKDDGDGVTICADGHTRCVHPTRCARYYKQMDGFVYFCYSPFDSLPTWKKAQRLIPPKGRSPLDLYAKNGMGQLSYTFESPGYRASIRDKLRMANQVQAQSETNNLRSAVEGIMNAAVAASAVRQMSDNPDNGHMHQQQGSDEAYFSNRRNKGDNDGVSVTDVVADLGGKTFHPPVTPDMSFDDDSRRGSAWKFD